MNFDKFLWRHRPLCVAQETARYAWHKTLGRFLPGKTPVWYKFGAKPVLGARETLPIDAAWHRVNRKLYRREHVFYNIDNALKANPRLEGLALVFFMGIGDYLYATPMIEVLAKKYPQLKLYGYVSKHTDRNNSPISGTLLETNPYISKVFYFDGFRNPLVWKNYNYEDAFKNIPPNFLAVPVYYEYGLDIPHRTASLFETFGLKMPAEFPRPVFYFPQNPPAHVAKVVGKINEAAKDKKGIVFLQLDSRGSAYTYPHTTKLAQSLIDEDWFVISVTKTDLKSDFYYQVDFKKFAFNDTCNLLHLLKKQNKVFIIAVNSVFWAASGGLDIPNLGLQHWVDKKVHNLWYPNITMVTDYKYPKIPPEKMIIANPADYTPYNKKIIDYKPQFILECFKKIA